MTFAMARRAINAYSTVGTETGVAAADPHGLILMLFEGAMLALADARLHLQRGATAAKGSAISKAILIIDSGLRASLDLNAGGELGQRLSMLYQYMSERLLFANMNNDAGAMDEVARLLAELNGAWAAIGKKPPPIPEGLFSSQPTGPHA
jgi:flagellar protein FliS